MASARVALPTRNSTCGADATPLASLSPRERAGRGRRRLLLPLRSWSAAVTMSASPAPQVHLQARASKKLDIPIMVNSCSGKMGKAVIKAADSAGLDLISMSFGCAEEAGKTVEVCGREIKVHGPSDRESALASVFREHLNMIVVDYTVPDAVNGNAELYCNVGVPF